MTDEKKPHTIALRLTPDEWRGLQYYMRTANLATLTAALRELLPVDQLAGYGRKTTDD